VVQDAGANRLWCCGFAAVGFPRASVPGDAAFAAGRSAHVRRHVTMTLPSLSVLGFIWFASELCLMTRRSGPGTTSKDRGSLRVIWLVNMVSIGLGIMAANHFRACVLPARSLFYVIGICVFVLGFVLRFYSIFYLGRFFTINVAIVTGHRLIDSGPYRFIRHPSYIGLLMMFFGLGLGIGNWVSVVIFIVPTFAVLFWRMEIEEAALLEFLGGPYRSYMKRTKRLIPMIY
jgi:protein-S-isoprenylcysteine O-methyltransferase Ste14